jgi:hypothetical protein
MSIKTLMATVREVAAETVACNPGALNWHTGDEVTVEVLMEDVEVDPEDAAHVMGDLNWGNKGIVVLPESIGDLTVGGNLRLQNNKLESLPESFGSLTVGGNLRLQNNKLESLPESFGSLTVGGEVSLGYNPVAESLNENSFLGLTLDLG